MSNERTPQGDIRVGHAGSFVCAIFKPRLSEAEQEAYDEAALYPPPIVQGIIEVNNIDQQVMLWHGANFGWSAAGRAPAFQTHVETRVTPILPERLFIPDPVVLGDKTVALFQEMEQKAMDKILESVDL